MMSALSNPYEFLIDLRFRNDFYCIRVFQKTSMLEAISTLHEAEIVVLVWITTTVVKPLTGIHFSYHDRFGVLNTESPGVIAGPFDELHGALTD